MKKFYAAKSYMGTSFAYDSVCWSAHQFDTKKERDDFVEKYEYKDGNRAVEKCARKTALKIIGAPTRACNDCILRGKDLGQHHEGSETGICFYYRCKNCQY